MPLTAVSSAWASSALERGRGRIEIEAVRDRGRDRAQRRIFGGRQAGRAQSRHRRRQRWRAGVMRTKRARRRAQIAAALAVETCCADDDAGEARQSRRSRCAAAAAPAAIEPAPSTGSRRRERARGPRARSASRCARTGHGDPARLIVARRTARALVAASARDATRFPLRASPNGASASRPRLLGAAQRGARAGGRRALSAAHRGHRPDPLPAGVRARRSMTTSPGSGCAGRSRCGGNREHIADYAAALDQLERAGCVYPVLLLAQGDRAPRSSAARRDGHALAARSRTARRSIRAPAAISRQPRRRAGSRPAPPTPGASTSPQRWRPHRPQLAYRRLATGCGRERRRGPARALGRHGDRRARRCRRATTSRSSSTTPCRASPTWCAGRTSRPRQICTCCCRSCSACRRRATTTTPLILDDEGDKLSKSLLSESLGARLRARRRSRPPRCRRRLGFEGRTYPTPST